MLIDDHRMISTTIVSNELASVCRGMYHFLSCHVLDHGHANIGTLLYAVAPLY